MFRDPQVNAYVADVEACMRFYTEQLGFVETFRTPETGPPAHVEVRLGGLILGFANLETTRQMHGLEVETGPRRAEVALWTDEVDAAFERWVAAGAAPLSPPHDFIGRLRGAWIADPAGGPVQIVMEIPTEIS